MKFATYIALVGAVAGTRIIKGTGMDDSNGPVARSSAEAQIQSAEA